jgi:predicted PhzF superfamily epimerase YddE/YHI9
MKLTMYQVDAFASSTFSGNPAAIIALDGWLDDGLLQDIASENNLSETAYMIDRGDSIDIRWFTPAREVDLCGHATLAAAFVAFECLGREDSPLRFQSCSGELLVARQGAGFIMDFPSERALPGDVDPAVFIALGARPRETWSASYDMLVFDRESDIRQLQPDFSALGQASARALIVTAPGEQVDFVSRFFAPAYGINEDPVTGSAHTILTPYWADRLGKTRLQARQVSPRGGDIACEHRGERVSLAGTCVLYMEATLML